MLINKISVMTLKIVISAQRGHGGGSDGRNNRGHKYSSLRGRASSSSNQRKKNNKKYNNCYLASYNKKDYFFKYLNMAPQSQKNMYLESNLHNQGL